MTKKTTIKRLKDGTIEIKNVVIRGETMNKENWEKEFKEKFTNKKGNVVAEDQEEVLGFIRQEIIRAYKEGVKDTKSLNKL